MSEPCHVALNERSKFETSGLSPLDTLLKTDSTWFFVSPQIVLIMYAMHTLHCVMFA